MHGYLLWVQPYFWIVMMTAERHRDIVHWLSLQAKILPTQMGWRIHTRKVSQWHTCIDSLTNTLGTPPGQNNTCYWVPLLQPLRVQTRKSFCVPVSGFWSYLWGAEWIKDALLALSMFLWMQSRRSTQSITSSRKICRQHQSNKGWSDICFWDSLLYIH